MTWIRSIHDSSIQTGAKLGKEARLGALGTARNGPRKLGLTPVGVRQPKNAAQRNEQGLKCGGSLSPYFSPQSVHPAVSLNQPPSSTRSPEALPNCYSLSTRPTSRSPSPNRSTESPRPSPHTPTPSPYRNFTESRSLKRPLSNVINRVRAKYRDFALGE